MTHRRSSGRDGGPASSWTRSPSVWTLGGADAPARRLRAALMSRGLSRPADGMPMLAPMCHIVVVVRERPGKGMSTIAIGDEI